MSKFISLSTSVLLAFLTSSFAASSYASEGKVQTEVVGHATKLESATNESSNNERLRHAPSLNDLDGMSSQDLNLLSDDSKEISNIEMVRSEYSIDLEPDEQSNLQQVKFSFEHPKQLKESFIVGNGKTFISFTNEQGNLIVGVKVERLAPVVSSKINLASLQDDVTKRFSDKENMLYGKYEVVKSTEDLAKGVIDLTIKAFLKKGADGILPDMQSFFYERNIVINNYLVTINTTVQGTQAQVALSQDTFINLSPMLLRIINSYQSPDLPF